MSAANPLSTAAGNTLPSNLPATNSCDVLSSTSYPAKISNPASASNSAIFRAILWLPSLAYLIWNVVILNADMPHTDVGVVGGIFLTVLVNLPFTVFVVFPLSAIAALLFHVVRNSKGEPEK